MKDKKDHFKNKKSNLESLKQQLQRESLLVRENSMEVLKEFELL